MQHPHHIEKNDTPYTILPQFNSLFFFVVSSNNSLYALSYLHDDLYNQLVKYVFGNKQALKLYFFISLV